MGGIEKFLLYGILKDFDERGVNGDIFQST